MPNDGMNITGKQQTGAAMNARAPLPIFAIFAFALAGSGAALAAGTAAVGIEAFYGAWTGTALAESEDSVYFALTQRDVSVRIAPSTDHKDGFDIAWTTVQRKKGDPLNPTEEIKETTATFMPAKKSGLWWDREGGDLINGGTMRWARIEDTTLVINTVKLRDDGSLETQTYRRTLSDRGMALSFSRVLDGKEVRTVTGRLVRTAN